MPHHRKLSIPKRTFCFFRFSAVQSFIAILLLELPLNAAELTFPKLSDTTRIQGELVNADFIHRTGQIRTKEGELMDFTMPPYAVMKYRGEEADLREVPLGTRMTFLMMPNENGQLTRLITTEDDQPVDESQRQKFIDFSKARGLPGWIEKTEGKQMIVTLFSGAPKTFQKTWMDDFAVGKEVKVCVSNDELRTWNVNVDGKRATVREVQSAPIDGFGSSGVRIVLDVSDMLEGFRKGRVVRLYGQSWPMKDFFTESLMGYGFAGMKNRELVENVAKEYPEQFPFRTDYSNAHLPWYQLKDDVKPPPFSEHLVRGELIKVDAATRTGQFRTERAGEMVDFTLSTDLAVIQVSTSKREDFGPARFKDLSTSVRYLDAEAKLEDLPLGKRYRFHLYQDANGAFTRCAFISDDYSHLALNFITLRIDALDLESGKLHVAHQLPDVNDYNRDMQRAPDIARSELRISKTTRVWKDKQPLNLTDLKLGDSLRYNATSEQLGKPLVCTDLWLITDDTVPKDTIK